MQIDSTNLENIVKVEAVPAYRIDVLNAHLDKGWIIVAKDSTQTGPDEVKVTFYLGWSSLKGDIQEVTHSDYDVSF